MKSGEIVPCGFFVARGDAPEVFDRIEEPLDKVALAIEREVAVAFDLAVGLRRDHRFDLPCCQGFDEPVAVVPLVAEKCRGLNLVGKGLCLSDVVCLPSGQAECEGISQGVDDGMDFRRQAAARVAYGLVFAPFLRAPALC